MSRVALDLPSDWLLGAAAILPLTSILVVYGLHVLGKVVHLKRNVFRSPNDGLDPISYIHSGKRTWKQCTLALLAAAEAVGWAVFSVRTGINGGDDSVRNAVGMGMVSLGWVSTQPRCEGCCRGSVR